MAATPARQQHLLVLLAAVLAACVSVALGQPVEQQPTVQEVSASAVAADEAFAAAAAAVWGPCGSPEAIIQCGWLPVTNPEEVSAYGACCELHRPFALTPAAVAIKSAAQQALAAVPRPDLANVTTPPNYLWTSNAVVGGKPASSCVAKAAVAVPTFTSGPRAWAVKTVTAPLLTKAQIVAVKAAAEGKFGSRVAAAVRRGAARLRAGARRTVERGATGVFKHPAGLVGSAELSLALWRLNNSITPQSTASQAMLTGTGVAPKFYRYNTTLLWNPPTDCPADYRPGPFPMAQVNAKWGGQENDPSLCPKNYPAFAPKGICAHISFVELDAQMSYKAALAYHATRDVRYARVVFDTVNAWAATNKAWGMASQNGPLEAGWGVAALARSLEVLRTLPEFGAARSAFNAWYFTYVHPQVDTYVTNSANVAKGGNLNVYGNWHSTIAEAWMSVAVLNDDAALWDRAVALFQATVKNYIRWGFDPATSGTRVIGECTETLRDIYHTEFGLGGLLQTAELAWQQSEDLYSSSSFALVAAMEVHARIINAWDTGKSEALLPPGFRFFETSMPKPPAGCEWSFDIGRQTWFARDVSSKAWVSDLKDGVKYLLGTKWLPTGWEVGFNHFAGRLGIPMPETAALIRRYPVESHEFHWGLGTLTHADTAAVLWRAGLGTASLCSVPPARQ